MKLNIGTDGKKLEGYINVDVIPEFADVCANMVALPFADGCIAEINTSHTMEHLTKEEAGRFVKEAYRVLEIGGKLGVAVPSILEMAQGLLENPGEEEDWIQRIYGRQLDQHDFHKWGWTPWSLRDLIEKEGFTTIELKTFIDLRPTPTLIYRGVKEDLP